MGYLIATRVRTFNGDPSEGSTKVICTKCGEEMWVSPEALTEMTEALRGSDEEIKCLCVECFTEKMYEEIPELRELVGGNIKSTELNQYI